MNMAALGFALLVLGIYLNWREIRRNMPDDRFTISNAFIVLLDLLSGASPFYLWSLLMVVGLFLIGMGFNLY
jgi:hypothetical protein